MNFNAPILIVILTLVGTTYSCKDSSPAPSTPTTKTCTILSDSSLSSGTVNTYTHNSQGQLITVETSYSGGGYTTSYTYDNNGRIIKVQNINYKETYTYSGNYRTVLFESGGPSVTSVASMHSSGSDTVWRYFSSPTIPEQMFVLKYQDGNLVSEEFHADYSLTGTLTYVRTTTYTYDDKPNPYQNHPIEKYTKGNANNQVGRNISDGMPPSSSWSIQYNADDYPITIEGPNQNVAIKYTCE